MPLHWAPEAGKTSQNGVLSITILCSCLHFQHCSRRQDTRLGRALFWLDRATAITWSWVSPPCRQQIITDKVKPLCFKGSPDLWWPWQGTARFRAVCWPGMGGGEGRRISCVSVHVHGTGNEGGVPNYTVSIFNSMPILWSFLFQHKHRAEHRFRQTSPAETLHCSQPRQRTRQPVTQGSCLLHPCSHTLGT